MHPHLLFRQLHHGGKHHIPSQDWQQRRPTRHQQNFHHRRLCQKRIRTNAAVRSFHLYRQVWMHHRIENNIIFIQSRRQRQRMPSKLLGRRLPTRNQRGLLQFTILPRFYHLHWKEEEGKKEKVSMVKRRRVVELLPTVTTITTRVERHSKLLQILLLLLLHQR